MIGFLTNLSLELMISRVCLPDHYKPK